MVAAVTPQNQEWTSQADLADRAYQELNTLRVSGTRSNVYQAVATILEGAYADEQYADFEKTLVLVTDGPDDLRLPAFDLERVLDTANAQNVRIFVVHLDAETELGTETLPLYRDDPRYYQSQDPCSADTDCKNFEECRVPQGSAAQSGAVEDPPTESYCLPKRGDDGRLGPTIYNG